MNSHAESKAIRAVIQNYMDGTYKADTHLLESVFHEKAVMNGYLGPNCLLDTPAAFVADIASAPSMESQGDPYCAEIESIRVEGGVATVVLSETGFRGDGVLVDFFQLIKLDGEWKIVAKLFTTL